MKPAGWLVLGLLVLLAAGSIGLFMALSSPHRRARVAWERDRQKYEEIVAGIGKFPISMNSQSYFLLPDPGSADPIRLIDSRSAGFDDLFDRCRIVPVTGHGSGDVFIYIKIAESTVLVPGCSLRHSRLVTKPEDFDEWEVRLDEHWSSRAHLRK